MAYLSVKKKRRTNNNSVEVASHLNMKQECRMLVHLMTNDCANSIWAVQKLLFKSISYLFTIMGRLFYFILIANFTFLLLGFNSFLQSLNVQHKPLITLCGDNPGLDGRYSCCSMHNIQDNVNHWLKGSFFRNLSLQVFVIFIIYNIYST